MKSAQVGANEAVKQLAEDWEKNWERPATDSSDNGANRGRHGKDKLGSLKPKIKEALNNVNKISNILFINQLSSKTSKSSQT